MKILDLENNYKVYYASYKKSDTVVIDNGTYEFKAGYLGSGVAIKFLNHFYKDVEGIKFDSIRSKSKYVPFTFDMVSGLSILEENIDQALEYLQVKKCDKLIITDAIYSPTRKELLRFLFEVYHFYKIQIGVDAVYSYYKNSKESSDRPVVIISLGHSSSYVYIVKDYNILDVYKLFYGGKLALIYLTNIIKYKFKEYNKNFTNILKELRCPIEYDKEVFEILEKLKKQDYTDSISIGGNIEEEDIVQDSVKKSRLVERLKNINKKIKVVDKNENSSDISSESEELEIGSNDSEKNTCESNNDKKFMPGMYKIRLYQFNNKIMKLLSKLQMIILKNEEQHEKLTDFPSFLNKKKQRYEQIIRELELREKSRKDSTNRKTYEFCLLLKTGELTSEEIEYKNKLKDCENTKIDENLITEKDNLLEIIQIYDKNYLNSMSTTYDLITSKNTNNILVNIDLLRASEVLFEPSLIGSDQMGLGEILENVINKYEDLKEIFITGGFSQIKGLKERIEFETRKYSKHSDISIKMADNPVNDPVEGARFSEMFEVYTYEDFKKGLYD